MGEAARCARAMSGVGGKTGTHKAIKRMINKCNFIAFASRGALFDRRN
ncbi:MAG: hypothetical protein JWN92_899 [Candidatus Acidoferrum typicum]|nr:hypothetical protein [Candidatus Acidoferrum typicum]